MKSQRWLVAVLAPLLSAACLLTTSLDGFSGGAGAPPPTGSDAFVDQDSAASDRALPVVPTPTPAIIATDVGGFFGAGGSQGTHLHFAKNTGEWIFFYLQSSDTTHLRSRVSRDFVTWSDGPTLVLPQPHTGDGRSFSVAYADISAHDVFHISLSLKSGKADRRHVHVRAVVEQGSLVYGGMTELSAVTLDDAKLEPDGPAVAVLSDGKVVELTGWHSPDGGTARTGNVVGWISTQSEVGTSWPVGFGTPFEIQVVAEFCNARAMLATPRGGIALWEAADVQPYPTNLSFAILETGAWSAPGSIDFEKVGFDVNDWSAASVDETTHVVRFAAKRFEHRVYDGNVGAWGPGSPVPARDHTQGQGVVVLREGSNVIAMLLDGDGALSSTTLASNAWSAWKAELAAGAMRSRLSGYSGQGGVAAVWMETVGTSTNIVGTRLR